MEPGGAPLQSAPVMWAFMGPVSGLCLRWSVHGRGAFQGFEDTCRAAALNQLTPAEKVCDLNAAASIITQSVDWHYFKKAPNA